MRARYDEGVAIRIGPEPCVGVREDDNEASVGEGIGQPLSRESQKAAEAEPVSNVEGNMCGPVTRGTDALPWSKTTSRTKGTRRNLGDLTFGRWTRRPPRPASGR